MTVVSYPDQAICRTEEGTSRKFSMVQSNLDYPDLDYPDFSIIRTFSLVPFFS